MLYYMNGANVNLGQKPIWSVPGFGNERVLIRVQIYDKITNYGKNIFQTSDELFFSAIVLLSQAAMLSHCKEM